jgi:hypothetical protein
VRTFLLADHGVDLIAHFSDKWLTEANRGVVALDGVLDECDVDVGCLSRPLCRPRPKEYRYSAPWS